MAVVKQGGRQEGGVMTTMGMRERRPPLCWTCRERKDGQLYGIDPHGAPICNDCLEANLRGVDTEASK